MQISKNINKSLQSFFLAILLIVWIVACQGKSNLNNESPSDCRIIQHAMGETCVPLNPQRVIALSLVDNVIALGIKPIGATFIETGIDSLLPQTTQIANIGTRTQPNLESILRLKPDLILGLDWNEVSYTQLSQIAPTVLVESGDTLDWKRWFKVYAEALGKTQEADKIMAAYQQRIADLQKQLGNRLSTTQVSVVSFWADTARIYLKQSFSGQIINDVGLSRPDAQNKQTVNENLSLELIPQMDGDVMFLMADSSASKLTEFTNHPLWSQLKVVQQRRVYEVDGEAWISQWTTVAANRVLDDLYNYLIDEWK